MCKYVWVKKYECKICGGRDSLPVDIAEGDHKCWLWKKRIVTFPGAMQTERVVDYEKPPAACCTACRNSRKSGTGTSRTYRGRIAFFGSLREIVNKYEVSLLKCVLLPSWRGDLGVDPAVNFRGRPRSP